MRKWRVGILGATGSVGQCYLQLLVDHPLFEVTFLAASSSAPTLAEALKQRSLSPGTLPPHLLALPVHKIDAFEAAACDFVFSAVDKETAARYETRYAESGIPVLSNASAHRMDPDVPLLIPEINASHLDVIPAQRRARGWSRGFIVAKPNCSLQSYLLPLYPLHAAFQVTKIFLTTLQAVSGAGTPGPSSLEMLDNLIPYIPEEEEKSEREPLKVLGSLQNGTIVPATEIALSAHCNRVPVRDGHTACVSVAFAKKPSLEAIIAAWRGFEGLSLPSAPARPVLYREEPDRPQPRLDRDAAGGMAVTVGRLRTCPLLDVRFVALSHNLLRGAAKGNLLTAELLATRGYFD